MPEQPDPDDISRAYDDVRAMADTSGQPPGRPYLFPAVAIVLIDLDNRFADLADRLEKVEQAIARLIVEREAGESRLAELEATAAWLRESKQEGR